MRILVQCIGGNQRGCGLIMWLAAKFVKDVTSCKAEFHGHVTAVFICDF